MDGFVARDLLGGPFMHVGGEAFGSGQFVRGHCLRNLVPAAATSGYVIVEDGTPALMRTFGSRSLSISRRRELPITAVIGSTGRGGVSPRTRRDASESRLVRMACDQDAIIEILERVKSVESQKFTSISSDLER